LPHRKRPGLDPVRAFFVESLALLGQPVHYLNISKVSVVVFVTPPPVPVIVMGYVPVLAVFETVRLKCELPEPGAAMGFGLKLAVTPEGSVEYDSEIAALNEPEVVVVTVAYPLWP
jgi:hypothetical protein